jgi:hypothetical protein
LPSVMLAAAMIWVLARTLPFLGAYGFDALRDSVIIMYGAFSFVVVGLLLEDGRRVDTVLRYYRVVPALLPAMAVGFWITKYWVDYVPRYGPSVPLVEITASSLGTHLAGIAIFALIGYRKLSIWWIAIWIAALAMLAATNRGATLAVFVPVVLALVVLGRLRLMLTTTVAGLAIVGVLLAAEATFVDEDEATASMARPVSARQIVENARSIVGRSGQQTAGTKQWRLDWWDIIIEDTVHGPHFWTGRGFGLNVAYADGFGETIDPHNPRPPTRSPHNAHMTMLARAGVPGLVLWSLVLASWTGMMIRAIVVARNRGHQQWSDIFLFVACYALSIVINATFDVTLEGPMQGIWFWCLFGFGIGSVMVYRSQAGAEARPSGR